MVSLYFSRTILAAPVPAVNPVDRTVSTFAHDAAEASADHARIEEWANRIRQADTAVAWLIARPDRRPPQVSYPSAVAAYREFGEVLKAL